ncbi:squalene/phytoene synthase family protein [Sphingomonas crusticola]|uniref:squalene/phytoene synthase family protein n=1 Tax=Sphingomonas crusticola TaxID=1697973 RepID=UPI001F07400E|nr:squalene/phytoene synthase family protein [Sphingomonas crusticola]
MPTELDHIADPERALAIAYAPAATRAALTALFQLDERFGQIVSSTTEPMIGLMRLAWWREALEKLNPDSAPAEPLLRALATTALPHGVTGAALAAIEDGWSALIDGDESELLIPRHGRERGRNLFAAAAAILGAADDRLPAAGEVWALADLGFHHSRPAVRDAALARARELARDVPSRTWPPAARPLAALFVLAEHDSRLGGRVQGSPARLLRILALRITGR